MSDIFRFSLREQFLARLRETLPGVTAADLRAFDALILRDGLLTDEGAPHPELVAWVQRILDRDAGDAVAVPVVPVPRPSPAGAMVSAW